MTETQITLPDGRTAVIRVRQPESYTPNPANTNRGKERGKGALDASLQTSGLHRGIVVSADGTVVNGNHAYQSASELGIAKAWVEIEVEGDVGVVTKRIDWQTAQDPKAVLAAIQDNRTSELNFDLDPAEFASALEILQDADLELPASFYNEDEIKEVFTNLDIDFNPPSDEDDEETTADLIEQAEQGKIESRVKPGEIWQLGRHRIACGDSTVEENVRALLGDRFGDVGMVWADAPFGIDLKPQRGITQAIANDRQWEAKDLWAAFIPITFQAMRQNTTAFLCQGWSEFDWTLPIVRKCFTVKSKIVWHKTQWGIGYYLRPQHEDILYCWKGQPEKPDAAISDVWTMARLNAPDHSCEKPTDLPMKAMEFASSPYDLIYDPFLGVAPSIIAAQKMEGDRTVYGFELSEAYCEIICQRYEQFTGDAAKLVGHLPKTQASLNK